MKYYSDSNLEIFYGTEDSAGLDLPYYDPKMTEVTVPPGDRVKLPTGIHLEMEPGTYGEIDTRSSTSKRMLLPMCRTIDWGYRGNIHVVLVNVGKEPQVIKRGEYLAQIIIKPYIKVPLQRVENRALLQSTSRGENGFGHTGNNKSSEV